MTSWRGAFLTLDMIITSCAHASDHRSPYSRANASHAVRMSGMSHARRISAFTDCHSSAENLKRHAGVVRPKPAGGRVLFGLTDPHGERLLLELRRPQLGCRGRPCH